MFFSENIYFLILFTLPAALNVIYNAHIRHVPVAKTDKSIELAECIIFCFAVFMCNIVVMHREMTLFAQYSLLQEDEILQFCIDTGFNYINFMIRYFMVNIGTSIGVLVIWYTLGQWCFRGVENIINKCKNRPEELKFSDVWSNVFETEKYIDINDDLVVYIEKGGTLITAGVVMIYSPPNQEKREFLLIDTDLVRQIFEDDRELPLEYKIFPNSRYEYYDVQQDLLIKLYDAKKYNEVYG
nr:MAG TPA: hypothetical protein [Caudoviricetes sp.]